MNALRFPIAVLCFAGFLPGNVWAQTGSPVSALALEQYGRLPLAFEQRGERFVARGQGYVVGLEHGKVSIGVARRDKTAHAVSLEFAGARSGPAVPGTALQGKVNYIRGNDPRKWQTGLATYKTVTYPDAYPGVDVVYYGNQQELEFDLRVKPGADPEAIRLKVGGAERLSLDGSGGLDLGDGLRVALPQIYQDISGAKKRIRGHYAIVGRDEVAFRIDAWDHTRPLVIDPTIVFSALLGGGLNSSEGMGIGIDSLGDIILAGYTYAADFPLLDAAQGSFKGYPGLFVTKINPAGTALIYSTYFGGSSSQYASGLAVDSTGAAWVTGYTVSTDFPLLNAAQATSGGGQDAFVARFNSTGVLQFSTYLGGNNYDAGYGIAVDGLNNGYVTGTTYGSFPVTSGVLQSGGGGNAFVTKYGPAGAVIYSTLLGGSGTYAQAIAVDSAFNAYVTGYSYEGTFTGMQAGGAQTTNKGGGDAFVAKINSTAAAYIYFTFLGGTGYDQGTAIAVDSLFNAYIGGQTSSTGLATTGAAYKSLAGAADGFAAKLNPAGNAFTYVTYLGGSRQDYLTGLALDKSMNVYLTGYTDSTNFPIVAPLQSTLPGNETSFFNSTNTGASWSAFDANIPGAVFQASINPSGASMVVMTESGIYRTVNGGSSWTQQFGQQFSSNGSYLARSPAAPGTIYATACCGNFYRSTDDGVTWNLMAATPSGDQGPPVADPLTDTTVYLFGSSYVYKSTDGGATWLPAATGLPEGIQVGSMAATSDGTLYAGTNGYGIFKSTNQGGSWSAVNTGLPANASAPTNCLTASGTTVYFSYGTVYKTTNGGASWAATSLGYDYGAYSVATSPQNPSVLYALTYSGVEISADGGVTWNAAGTGLPSNVSYYNSELVVNPGNAADVFVVTPTNQAAFVAKLNSTGSALIWSTYLGDAGLTYAYAAATDGIGDVFVTGYTNGGGFPVTSSALPAGTYGAFISKISDTTTACSTLTVSPESAVASLYGGPLTFDVVAPSGCAWTATTNESWAVIASGASGTGVGTIIVQPSNNSSGATQTATLTVGSRNVTITQASDSCSYTLDKTSYPVAPGGGTVTAVLTTPAGCPWTVTNYYRSAVSLTTASSGTGSGTIGMTVGPDPTGAQRTFYLSVGTAQIQIAQATPAPTITGIANLADSSAPPLAPGSLATLSGTFLAASTASASGGAAPFTLGGSKITVNGVPAAMLYASPGQINFQIPYETATGGATVVVTGSSYVSNGFQFNVAPASPGIFASRILSPNAKANTAANPAAPSGVATVFYTGAGAAKPVIADGAPAPQSPLSIPVAAVSATVGGLAAAVTSGELTPGIVGEAQVNVQIPAGLLAGSYPLILTENGLSGLPAAIYVSGAAPVLTNIVPGGTPIGSPATQVTITGSNFGTGSMVQYTPAGGVATLIAPGSIATTQITVTIPATMLTVEGIAKVGIQNALGTVSNHGGFTIGAVVATTTTLTSSGNPSILGRGVTLTATVSPASSEGSVTFYDGTTVLGTSPLAAGKAVLTTVMLPAGARSLRACYIGGGYLPSSSAVLPHRVDAVEANDFAGAVNYATGGIPYSFALGDFNGDGKADIAAPGEYGVQVLLGNGDGTFQLAAAGSGAGYWTQLAAGDFNGDGKTDLAASEGTDMVYVLLGNGDGTFQAPVGYETPYGATWIAVSDFNGDGKADLVVAGYNAAENGGLSVLFGNGDGTFQAANSSGVGPGVGPLAVGDFNGDGKADLAIVSASDTISVLLGNGNGTFQPAVTYAGGFYPQALAVTDLNGDGKLDIAVGTESGPFVLLGNGDGTFAQPGQQNGGAYIGYGGIAVGDINGDGKIDIVETNSYLDYSSYPAAGIYLGNGDGTFQAAVYYAIDLNTYDNSQPVVVADFNGDGRSDVAVGNAGAGNMNVLLGLAPATGPIPTSTALTSSTSSSIYGQDITLTAQVSPSTVGAVTVDFFLDGLTFLGTAPLNGGVGSITVPTPSGGSHTLTAVYPGDIAYAPSISPALDWTVSPAASTTTLLSSLNPSNAGQSVTLRASVFYSTATGQVTFMDGSTVLGKATLGEGSATLTVGAFSAGSHSLTAIYSGDPSNKPGTSAVLTQTVYSSRTSTTTALISSLNPSTLGQSVTLTATVTPTAATGTVTFYDGVTVLETEPLSGGTAKLAGALPASGKRSIRAYYDGDLTHSPSASASAAQTVNAIAGVGFAPVVNYATGSVPYAVAMGDFNGDGKADLAIANENVSILPGKGDGTFAPAVTYAPGTYPRSIAVGDFNGDGKADLAIAVSYNGVAVLTGNGDGTFGTAVNYAIGDTNTGSAVVAVSDLNGDGHADLVSANYDGTLSVLLGKGDGTFGPAGTFSAANQQVLTALVIADFNGDGIPDLAAGNTANVDVFLGNGDGSFQIASTYPILTGDPNSIAAGDFNGDGKADLAIPQGGTVGVLLGNGDGTFQSAASYNAAPDGQAYAAAIGDFNGDGKPDLVVAGFGYNGSGVVNVLLGNGDGTFQAPVNYTAGSESFFVAVGDFNGDGRADLALPDYYSDNVDILLGAPPKGQTITFGPLSAQTIGTPPPSLSATATSGLAVTFQSNSTTICTVSGVTVKLVAIGTCSVTASQAGNSTWAAAPTVTQAFKVSGEPQTITFGALAGQTIPASPPSLSATATSGLAVAFQSNSTTICTVSGVTVKLVALGTCSVTASQAGNSTWAAAPTVTQTFKVSGEPQTITFGALAGQTIPASPPSLSATATSGLAVTFQSNSTTICTVSGVTVKLVAIGTCSVTASQAGNSTWAAAPTVTQTFNVAGEPQTITFGALTEKTLNGAAPPPLSATATSGLTVTFASNSKTVCTVSGVTVTLLTTGTCSITASQAGNSIYTAAPAVTQTFTVLAGA